MHYFETGGSRAIRIAEWYECQYKIIFWKMN